MCKKDTASILNICRLFFHFLSNTIQLYIEYTFSYVFKSPRGVLKCGGICECKYGAIWDMYTWALRYSQRFLKPILDRKRYIR